MKNWKKLIVTAAAFGSLALFAGCAAASALTMEEATDQVTTPAPTAVVAEQETGREEVAYAPEVIVDGAVSGFEAEQTAVPVETQPAGTRPGSVTLEEAKAIAFAHAGVSEADICDRSWEQDDGRYEIEFDCGGWEYEYEISFGGEILHVHREQEHHSHAGHHAAETQPREQKSQRISGEKALAIALNHAGVTDARDRDVEWDDGRWEVSFESGKTEYEYRISADGSILHWEKEQDD